MNHLKANKCEGYSTNKGLGKSFILNGFWICINGRINSHIGTQVHGSEVSVMT